jgi:predicted transposase YbfD/YdcC
MLCTRPDVIEVLSAVPDPRVDRTKAHSLCAILVGTLVAVICDCDCYVEVADFMESQRDWLSQYVDMTNGAPSHDTISRVFRLLDPVALSKAFYKCLEMLQVKLTGKVVAIDGKCVRGSFDRIAGQKPIHMVSAWAVERGLVLGQVKVNEKSNEITAIPELLEMLDLKGAIITIDAMGTQRKIAQLIHDKGGDYVLAVKENQGGLHDAVKSVLDIALDMPHEGPQPDEATSFDNHHGRTEYRRFASLSVEAIAWAELDGKWPGLRSLVAVERRCITYKKTTVERRYFISSLPPSVKPVAMAIRSHWGIENGLHWVLDISFREDHSRVRKDHSPENMAVIRHFTMNILKRDISNISIRRKRKKAAREVAYREQLLKN